MTAMEKLRIVNPHCRPIALAVAAGVLDALRKPGWAGRPASPTGNTQVMRPENACVHQAQASANHWAGARESALNVDVKEPCGIDVLEVQSYSGGGRVEVIDFNFAQVATTRKVAGH